MKLWLQGLILIGLPLGFQILFAVTLIINLHRIDSAVTKETTSKQILNVCQQMRVTSDQFMMAELSRRYIPPEEAAEARKSTMADLAKHLKTIEAICPSLDEQSKKIVIKCRDDTVRMMQVVSTAETVFADNVPKIALSRFSSQVEYYEEVTSLMRQLVKDDKLIRKHFSPITREFSPQALEGRQFLLSLITAGILGNLILSTGLAIFYGRKTLARFAVLIGNIKQFGSGSAKLQSLSGDDELAELGRSFNEMAEARIKAEELRKTMLEMVSHDLKSPLLSCTLTLHMVLQKFSDLLDPSVLRSLRRVNSDLSRLVRMADTLLTVGKLEHGEIALVPRSVYLEDLLAPTVDAVRGLADVKGIGIEMEHESDVEIICDADRVIQVLVNFVSNSIKFAPSDSVVTVRVSLLEHACRFEVIDEGPGVPAEMQKKLFQKFSQLEQPSDLKSSGSGLGLYVSKLLVDAHGGTIGCSSPENGGACFWFELPKQENQTAS
ncbi:MAG: HAMP domain-containing histidine kinase [Cyanobacteria bacterium]|nr:HAMP domain-containing histidine kinase [Cyanobacteriota bacterium]